MRKVRGEICFRPYWPKWPNGPTFNASPSGKKKKAIIYILNCLPRGCLIRNCVQWCFLPPEKSPESDGIPQGFESSGLRQNSSLSGLSQFYFLPVASNVLWRFMTCNLIIFLVALHSWQPPSCCSKKKRRDWFGKQKHIREGRVFRKR